MKVFFLLITFLFISCADFQKNCQKECEEIIKDERAFRQDCFKLVDDQDKKITEQQVVIDSLERALDEADIIILKQQIEIKKCQNMSE